MMTKQTVRNFAKPAGELFYEYTFGSRIPFHKTDRGVIVLVAAGPKQLPYYMAQRYSDGKWVGGPGFSFDDAMAALEYRPLK